MARYYLDICGPVSRHLLTVLSAFAPDSHSLAEISRLGKDPDAFQKKVISQHLNIAQLLDRISSSVPWTSGPILHSPGEFEQITTTLLFNLLLVNGVKKTIAITAVVESQIRENWSHQFHGVPSSYLQALSEVRALPTPPQKADKTVEKESTHQLSGPRKRLGQCSALINVRRSKFRLPKDSSVPIVMIGPGTGVAPFRAFVHERALQSRLGREVGKTTLFYGCRRRDEDFIYENEWKV